MYLSGVYMGMTLHLYTVHYIDTLGFYLIRNFTSPVSISRSEYENYMKMLNLDTSNFDFTEWGTVSDTFNLASLLPTKSLEESYEKFKYDIRIHKSEFVKYMDFLKNSVEYEKNRPVIQLENPHISLLKNQTSKVPDFYTLFEAASTKKVETVEPYSSYNVFTSPFQDITEFENVLGDSHTNIKYSKNDINCLLFCNYADGTTSDKIKVWNALVKKYKSIANTPIGFYIVYDHKDLAPICGDCSEKVKTSSILYKGEEDWTLYDGAYTESDVSNIFNQYFDNHSVIVHKLSNNTLLRDRSDTMWKRLIGTAVFPNISILESLTLYKSVLKWEKPDFKQESELNTTQQTIISSILSHENLEDLDDMSFEHCMHLFKQTASKKIQKTKQSVSADMSYEFASEMDKYSIVSDTLEDALYADLQSYAKIHDYGILLHILHKSNNPNKDEIMNQLKLGKLSTGWDTVNNISHAMKYIHQDTTFLQELQESDTPYHEVIEAQLLWSILKSSPKHMEKYKPFIYKMIVSTFCVNHIEKAVDSKQASSALWEHFQVYLREKTDVDEFDESQTTFNEILRSLGWTQKRISSGKVWVDMKYKY